jgi:hypothetical protein
MSSWHFFLWGCLGGFSGYLTIFVLPELVALYGASSFSFNFGRILIAAAIGLIWVGVGGVAALAAHASGDDVKQAIAYGAGGLAIVGGFVKGVT